MRQGYRAVDAPSGVVSSSRNKESKQRKMRSIVTPADYQELERHYQFLPESTETSHHPPEDSSDRPSSWQERMVRKYHQHLYKEYVLADLSQACRPDTVPLSSTGHRRRPSGQIGLRWRTAHEVKMGKGSRTCGNKHCPSLDLVHEKSQPCTREHNDMPSTHEKVIQDYLQGEAAPQTMTLQELEQREWQQLDKLPYGALQSDYEVPFTYVEQGVQKIELVKLRLCARCAPLLFLLRKRDKDVTVDTPALDARMAREGTDGPQGSDDSDDSRRNRRKRKKKQKRKQKDRKKGGADRKKRRYDETSSDDEST